LNVVQKDGWKNPDAINEKSKAFSDAKVPVTKNIVSGIQNNIASASKQGAEEVVFRFQSRYSVNDLEHGLYNSFMNDRNKNIRTVIFIYHDGEIVVHDVDELRDAYKIAKGKPTK